MSVMCGWFVEFRYFMCVEIGWYVDGYIRVLL